MHLRLWSAGKKIQHTAESLLLGAFCRYHFRDYSIDHWLRHVSESQGAPTANQLAPFGYAATKNADREVSLPSGGKYFNVTRLETLKLNVGGKSVVWTFDTLGTAAFPLS